MASATLLDPAFVRELEALRRSLQVRARSGAGGEHLAKRRGGSAEFLEHRPYAPGDDLRRIDWPAFARTGEPVLKLFRTEEDVVVRLIVDASASLGEGQPPKLATAQRLAAGIAYMALARSERVQVAVASTGGARLFQPSRGKAALTTVLRELDGIAAGGETNLAAAVEDVMARSPRPGMLVVVSDFFDPGPFLAALGRAASAGHDVALVQVLSPEEVDPPYEGDLALEDSETGALVEVTLDPRAVGAYLERLGALIEALRAHAKRHRAGYVRALTTEPIVDPVRRFVGRSVD